MTWATDVRIETDHFVDAASRMAFVRVAKALLPSIQRLRRQGLANVLLDHCPQDALQRIVFIKDAAQRLIGNVVPLERPSKGVNRHERFGTRVRNAAHRWALANLDE